MVDKENMVEAKKLHAKGLVSDYFIELLEEGRPDLEVALHTIITSIKDDEEKPL